MLHRLRVENHVLIREAELELAPGLNAITGETGAGKTILAQAIGLLLGTKGDTAFIGSDGDEAYVEAELDLPAGLLEDEELGSLAELKPEDEEGLVLARRVFADGRTRAYAWGRAAARTDVAAAGERLIAMSGQFEQRRLARATYQLDVLDAFCGDEQLRWRAEARVAWRELRRVGDELRDVELRLREAATELRGFLASLDAEPDRLEQIEAELDRIAEAKRRFRCTSYEELLARAAEAQAELDALEGGADPIAAASKAVEAADRPVEELAIAMRKARQASAAPFATGVVAQ